jgi:hypothetical protein
MTAVDSERHAQNPKTLLGVAKALASEINLDKLLQVIVAKAAEGHGRGARHALSLRPTP